MLLFDCILEFIVEHVSSFQSAAGSQHFVRLKYRESRHRQVASQQLFS